MSKQHSPTFQEAVAALDAYWANYGCLIWHPYYAQVGAGTMNPATFLRVLGPEPWDVAYVEPSVRPDDARYGENPNRMGLFYQYQVILKPDPGNPQDLYLRSLEEVGIDLSHHDMRFVEDNWQQPALGAWGLGWEVWMDGLEITQFTYFQQAGGQRLDPVSVELTYGLERILMAMQGVEHFAEVRWNKTHSYGDLNLTAEREHSKYYFETADIDRLLGMYQDFQTEAERALQAGLLMPAYDYLLKCSHTFNVLDTRGAIGVTERASYFGGMRELARQVAQAYIDQREQQGFPWMPASGVGTGSEGAAAGGAVGAERARMEAAAEPSAALPGGDVKTTKSTPSKPADFLLELGTEELPAGDLTQALRQLKAAAAPMFDSLRLEHGNLRVMGTPRRLILHAEHLAPRQADLERQVKGPPWAKAFDSDGEPTPAARGFAGSAGVAVDDLRREELDGGEYAVAFAKEAGMPAAAVLPQALAELVAGLRFDKAMRWNREGTAFSRPIRWILALHGPHPIELEYAGLTSQTLTHGLRGEQGGPLPAATPAAYFELLAAQGILVDPAERRAEIERQIERLASEVGGSVPPDPDLLQEVTNLVEAPVALRGEFAASHLQLPPSVLTSVLKKHQRCFPVEQEGRLAPYFIAVSNGVAGETATHGHEQVVKARFADAAYFVKRDQQRPLDAFLPRLETLTFQAELGSVADKARRVQQLAGKLAQQFDLGAEERKTIDRAAQLCKADLATQMVVEMTSLQGTMGRYYALQSGEAEAVATAIYEHYLPHTAGDKLPGSEPGAVLAIADRLDTLIGLFSIGAQPTGTRDPYGLRRAAIGLAQILIDRGRSLDLREALRMAWAALGEQGAPAAATEASKRSDGGEDPAFLEDCLEFIRRRLEGLLLDQGWPHDVVQSVLACRGNDPARAAEAVEQLAKWVQQDDWMELLNAFARSARITRDLTENYQLAESELSEESTVNLHKAVVQADGSGQPAATVDEFVERFRPLVPVIDQFFDNVLVMSDDRKLRENRLALLQQVVRLADGVADLSKLEGF